MPPPRRCRRLACMHWLSPAVAGPPDAPFRSHMPVRKVDQPNFRQVVRHPPSRLSIQRATVGKLESPRELRWARTPRWVAVKRVAPGKGGEIRCCRSKRSGDGSQPGEDASCSTTPGGRRVAHCDLRRWKAGNCWRQSSSPNSASSSRFSRHWIPAAVVGQSSSVIPTCCEAEYSTAVPSGQSTGDVISICPSRNTASAFCICETLRVQGTTGEASAFYQELGKNSTPRHPAGNSAPEPVSVKFRQHERGLHRDLFGNRSEMASPEVPDCSDVPRRYQKSSTPMAISTCSPPSVKSAADSGSQAETFALVDHLHRCVASAPRVGITTDRPSRARPRHHGSHRLQGNGCLARQVPPSVLFQPDADRFTRVPQTSRDRRQIAEAPPAR